MEGQLDKLSLVVKRFNFQSYIQKIYDHRQSHAVYGLSSQDELDKIKAALTEEGCSRFRKVKTRYGFYILCFYIK